MLFFPLINVKVPIIVGILTFMSRKNFMLSRVEHEKSFITSGPGGESYGFVLSSLLEKHRLRIRRKTTAPLSRIL